MKIPNDQFYTKQTVSNYCCQIIKNNYPELLEGSLVLEPSAGTGTFINAFKSIHINDNRILAYDIDPKHPRIKKQDFLQVELPNKKIIAIGNPPFGKRAHLAMDFFNHCAKYCHSIAFIVPVQFQKYSVQTHLDQAFHLIYEELLDPKSFENNGKDLIVRCCFQIWTKREGYIDKRITKRPDISHPDFEMFLYNNTPQAKKYFDKQKYGWDFAVPRQGFYDYSLRIKNEEELNPKIQYMFFKGKNKTITKRISSIDFEKLSHRNTTIKGYGKADVVDEYRRKFKC